MIDSSSPRGRTPVTREGLRADVWLAGGLLVCAILSTALGSVAGLYGEDTPGMEWGLLYAIGLTAPLAVRRRWPVMVAIAVAIAFFIGVSFRIPEVYVGNISVFIALYTVGAWVDDRRRATIVRVSIIVGMSVWLLVTMFQSATSPADDDGLSRAGLFSPFVAFMLMQLLVNAAFFAGAYYMGDRAHVAALERRALEERTRELEAAHDLAAAQAVALDRVRIARELHDVVAHHVSAMGVQAGAARAILEKDPDAARTALTGVEQSARSALADLRQLLETLREPGGEPTEGSTLRLDGIDALVAHATENGLPTRLTLVGEPVELSETVQANLYRIAQEALTNARRHSGPDARADVVLRYGGDDVELEIVSTGRNAATGSRTGLGIVGMRERAAASGGRIEIGPRARGGFLVRVRVPASAAVLA